MNQSNQSNQNYRSTQSDRSNQRNQSDRNYQNYRSAQRNQRNQSDLTFLPKHGYYRNLRVYRLTEIIYDITFYFTQHYLQKGDRTIDQMVQAARSGKQNIAEGNQAAATSSETEIKLTNVAKASLEELLTDYEDYLRVRGLAQWQKGHERLEKLREYVRTDAFLNEYALLITKMSDEEICNLSITLIHQAMYMLQRLLETMQRRFVTEGGIKEQMFKARTNYRSNQSGQSYQNNQSNQSNRSDRSDQSNRSDQRNRSDQSDQRNRSDRSDQRNRSDQSDRSDRNNQSGQSNQNYQK